MEQSSIQVHRESLWKSYSRAVSFISILTFVVSFVIGGYDLLKLIHPQFTLNSALQEKYKTNESYTEFGTFKKKISEEQITHERIANYQKLLRMERQNARQRLIKIGFALFAVMILNGVFVFTLRWRRE